MHELHHPERSKNCIHHQWPLSLAACRRCSYRYYEGEGAVPAETPTLSEVVLTRLEEKGRREAWEKACKAEAMEAWAEVREKRRESGLVVRREASCHVERSTAEIVLVADRPTVDRCAGGWECRPTSRARRSKRRSRRPRGQS